MHEEFWQARWARNEIGFHLKEVNPHLQACWAQLAVPAGSEVLVPLCGKSLDLAWLAGQGYRVLGVARSRRAVEDFLLQEREGVKGYAEEARGMLPYRRD